MLDGNKQEIGEIKLSNFQLIKKADQKHLSPHVHAGVAHVGCGCVHSTLLTDYHG